MNSITKVIAVVGLGLAMTLPASATVLDLDMSQGVYIRESQSNQGTNGNILIGTTSTADDFIRGLFSFDLTDPDLVGATINSVSLTFTFTRDDPTSENATETIELFNLTSAYTETAATWTQRTSVDNWTTPGGDFSGLVTSADANPTTVSDGSTLVFGGSGLQSIVESSIGGSVNFLGKLANEDNTRSIFFIDAGRNGNVSPPVLSIDYTAIPEPGTYASFAGLLGVALVALRRRK